MNRKPAFFALTCIFLAVFSGCGGPLICNIMGCKHGESPYAGPPGTGNADDPFIVHDVETLFHVGKPESGDRFAGWGLDKHYIQVRDISIKESDYKKYGPWAPIGEFIVGMAGPFFSGTYDGGMYTIKGLTINSTKSYLGLFGYLNQSGSNIPTVKNVILADVKINCGASEFVGSVAGVLWVGKIENCRVSGGSVNGSKYVGGVVGLAGQNAAASTVENSFAKCTVNGNSHVGGITGWNRGSIKNCYTAGNITADGNYAGGVVGWNLSGIVEYCYAAGSVSGADNAGGVIGYNYTSGNAEHCVALNDGVNCPGPNVGRVAGFDEGALSYNYGDVKITNKGTVLPTGSHNTIAGSDFTTWEAAGWTVNATKAAANRSSPWWNSGGIPRLWFE